MPGVEQVRARGRKGALAALRDAMLLKTVYAYGLRRRETAMLDLVDFRLNSRAVQYGLFGSVQVRYGKAGPLRQGILGQRAEAAHGADGAGDGLDRRGAHLLAR